jgi:hypothetical protein
VSVCWRTAWIFAGKRDELDDLGIARNRVLRERARIKGRNGGYRGNERARIIRQRAKHAMRLIAGLLERRIRVGGVISAPVADDEQVAGCGGFRRRKVADDGSAQDEVKREGKACRGGDPAPQAPSISAQLQQAALPPHSLALRRDELKTLLRSAWLD